MLIWGIMIGIPIGAVLFSTVQFWRTIREVYQWMRFGG